ncbi:MAG: helix-turn-helix transcriptional regulator [Anaerovoracaceae bacterium]|nr:helix-turn-helix domain-containing protein [Clostridiales bacterium]MDY2933196.1 helix-turn-helix transcriptional regulator [Anaerovoracaceae bacterium]
MLGENLKALRKQKGMSQEVMAQQLNVVRQTVSKWEQGLSVPDAQMLTNIAELFEVPVSSLLGESIEENVNVNEIAVQLAVLNQQLAARRGRTRKIVRIVLIAAAALIAGYILLHIVFGVIVDNNRVMSSATLTCSLDGETYVYGINYDDQYRIHEGGGDAFVANHTDVETCDDANVAIAHIEDWFKDRGGSVDIEYEQIDKR